jgi:hypothetical protein
MRRDRKGARSGVAHALLRAVSTLVSTSFEALPAERSRPALLVLVMLSLLTATASAQLALYSFDGTTEGAVGATFNFGNVAVGSTANVRFRVFNNGNSPATLSMPVVSGAGFSILPGLPSFPYIVAPANFLEFTVQVSTALLATYNANLQVNNISVILLATAVTPPQLTAVSGCTVSNGVFSFGNVTVGSLHLCNFTLVNPGSQPMLISTIGLSGGFQFQQNPATPLTLAANQGTMFTVEITPGCGTASFSGSLTVNSQAYSLTGSAITPSLPKPLITFDVAAFSSGEQHSLTLSLPSAPPCAVTGNLNLAFASTAMGVTDDASIVFVQGSRRSLQFAVAANSTQVLIAGQQSVVFQTGTTAGTITFTVTGTPLAADPTTTISIPPAPISIDLAAASNQVLGQLNVEVTGFDNTYTAGAMSFTFFDAAGKQVGAVINANFTSCFAGYFGLGAVTTGCSPSGQNSGSAFLMQVSFPIEGNQALVGTVQATLTNSAGPAQTGSLTFQ